jgi:hypothetical protein
VSIAELFDEKPALILQDYASTYVTKSEFKQLEKEVHNLSKDLEKVKMNFKSKK